jgi:DNA-binding transcriptional MerR regulator
MDSERRAARGAQGVLFPDSAWGDAVPDELEGYRGPVACKIVGVTYRQLDYWARTGLVVPTLRDAHGSGSQRLYSYTDLLMLTVVKRLLDTGVSLQNIRVAVEYLRHRGIHDLAAITLFSDGTTIYECTTANEVVDLLRGGQGVFGIAIGVTMREVTATIRTFPSERPAARRLHHSATGRPTATTVSGSGDSDGRAAAIA